MKNSNGIEPPTFQFVAQHLNHCATAVPRWTDSTTLKCTMLEWPAIPCFVKTGYISKLEMAHTYAQTSY